MSDEYGNNTLTPGRLGIMCLAGPAMWALIIWTGFRWWEVLS